MAKIRGIIAIIQFVITVTIVIFAMYMFKNHKHKIIKMWMNLQIKFLGVKLVQEGEIDTSCEMVLINHQSLLDIIMVEYIHSKHIAWVAKRQIEKLFFFGHIIKAPHMISIDRENKTGLVHLLKEAKDRINKGRPIAIFPEGTRSDGQRLLKFKSGAKIVANKLNLKVQPILVFNTRNVFDSQKITATPGVVKVKCLKPIQASKDTNWFEELEEKMNEEFKKEINA